MSNRSKTVFYALGGVAVLMIALALALAIRGPTSGWLLDGAEVVLQKASYGTNHLAPKAPLADLLRRLPAKWQAAIGWRPSSGDWMNSVGPIFTFWLKFSNRAGATQPINYAIADENGFEAPMVFTGSYGDYLPGGFSTNSAGLVRGTDIFPRRSRKLKLRLYQQDASGNRRRVAEFSFRNDAFSTTPGWTPQRLPIEQQTNDITFTLVEAKVGVTPPSPVQTPYSLQRGEWSEFRFRVSRQGQPSAGWAIKEMIISDEAGSRLRVSAEDNGSFNGQFGRAEGDDLICLHRWNFWSDQSAWKLSVHFEQAAGLGYWIEYLVRPKFLTRPEMGGGQQNEPMNTGYVHAAPVSVK